VRGEEESCAPAPQLPLSLPRAHSPSKTANRPTGSSKSGWSWNCGRERRESEETARDASGVKRKKGRRSLFTTHRRVVEVLHRRPPPAHERVAVRDLAVGPMGRGRERGSSERERGRPAAPRASHSTSSPFFPHLASPPVATGGTRMAASFEGITWESSVCRSTPDPTRAWPEPARLQPPPPLAPEPGGWRAGTSDSARANAAPPFLSAGTGEGDAVRRGASSG